MQPCDLCFSHIFIISLPMTDRLKSPVSPRVLVTIGVFFAITFVHRVMMKNWRIPRSRAISSPSVNCLHATNLFSDQHFFFKFFISSTILFFVKFPRSDFFCRCGKNFEIQRKHSWVAGGSRIPFQMWVVEVGFCGFSDCKTFLVEFPFPMQKLIKSLNLAILSWHLLRLKLAQVHEIQSVTINL